MADETQIVPEEKDYSYHTGNEENVLAPVAPEATTPVPTTEPAPTEPVAPATPETPVATPEVAPVPEVAKPTTPATTPEKPAEVTAVDWKAALKTADKWEALKELGYNSFAIDALKYYERTGSLAEYAEVKSVDYNKMTPEQLIRLDFKKKNPGLSEKTLNFKFDKELSEKYYLNREDYPENSEEAEIGQELLRVDAEQRRKEFIAGQEQFKAPEPTPDLDATKREADLQQQRAALGSAVMNNEATINLQKAKTIVYGEGEESFNYPVTDVQPLVDAALNTILNSGRTDLTGVNLDVFYKQLAYGKDPVAFETAFAKHHQAIGKKQFQTELQNVTPPNPQGTNQPAADEKDYSVKYR